jgi:ribosomal-protein-alanine N-acetyltransferase
MLSLNFYPFPELTTERLLLKKITNEHASDLFQMRADKDVMKYIDRPLAQTIDDAIALIKIISDTIDNNDGITWGIFLKDDTATLIGTIGFWRMQKEHYRAEIGYMLHPVSQGKGLMQEAIKKALEYGFTVMQLHSVEANVNPANDASKKLLEKIGFVQEAYFKENYYYNGRFVDSAIYSLLASN